MTQITKPRLGSPAIDKDLESMVVKNAPSSLAPHPQMVRSEELLGGRGELLILHAGRQYRLRITQNGKLILNA